MRPLAVVWAAALAAAVGIGCSGTTARLPGPLKAELEAEGIVRRMDDGEVRYTRALGASQQSWEERKVSIIVTKARVLIHDNGEPLTEITSRSTGNYSVRREGGRVSLGGGSGQGAGSWAFHPPDDVEGWTRDIRAVIRATADAGRTSPEPAIDSR